MTETIRTKGGQKIGCAHATDPQGVQKAIVDVLGKRIQKSIREDAIPLYEKREMFKKAVKTLLQKVVTPKANTSRDEEITFSR